MKKGFTLIELLAVIVILAIIALIATPIILGIINNAKKESDKRSVELYVKAAELAVARKNLTSEFKPTTCNVLNGACTCDGKEIQIDVDNGSSINGTITFNEKGVVTSNTLVSKKIETVSFAEDDWETIVLLKNSGIYHVGDTKEIDMGTFGTHTVRIANTTPCDGTLESETACGFVLEFVDIIKKYPIYKGTLPSNNKDGWALTSIRTYINNDIYNALPQDLKDIIIETDVASLDFKKDITNFIVKDKLYLLSLFEVMALNLDDPSGLKDSSITRQLDYYENKGVNKNNTSEAIKKDNTNTSSEWWLRIYFTYCTNCWRDIRTDGSVAGPHWQSQYGISPAFRI